MAPVGKAAFLWITVEFCVAHSQQAKGILVESQPDVEPVLFDAIGRPSSGSTLTTQPPAELVDGNVIPSLMFRSRQLEGSGDISASTANGSNLDGPLLAHTALPKSMCALGRSALPGTRGIPLTHQISTCRARLRNSAQPKWMLLVNRARTVMRAVRRNEPGRCWRKSTAGSPKDLRQQICRRSGHHDRSLHERTKSSSYPSDKNDARASAIDAEGKTPIKTVPTAAKIIAAAKAGRVESRSGAFSPSYMYMFTTTRM